MKKLIYAIAAFAALVSCTCQEKKEIGIQLYSVRELIGNPEKYAANHETVLKQLGEMGYTAVEPACYSDGKLYGVEPEQFKADCEAAGLKVISTHVGHQISPEGIEAMDFTADLEWWKQCIAAHKAAGCEYIVMPGMPHNPTIEVLKLYCDYYNAIGKMCAEQGIKFGYHNHSYEYVKIGDVVMYDYLLENTDPEYVFFEMDVFWTTNAQASPVEYYKRYPGRFTLMHIKDVAEVGQSGRVGFDAIFNNFDVAGCKGFVVEMEKSGVGDIMETCRISADYLKNADFVKASYAD